MCLRIFKPTPRRLLLFLIFLAFTLSGLLTVLSPFQQLFGLPYVLSEGYTAFAGQIIYSYILACIYAFGYVWLDARIRKRYPHMNDIVQRSQSLPVAEETVREPEPPAVHKPRAPRKPARIKKAVKRHKR
jgi:hypothetical protein